MILIELISFFFPLKENTNIGLVRNLSLPRVSKSYLIKHGNNPITYTWSITVDNYLDSWESLVATTLS